MYHEIAYFEDEMIHKMQVYLILPQLLTPRVGVVFCFYVRLKTHIQVLEKICYFMQSECY